MVELTNLKHLGAEGVSEMHDYCLNEALCNFYLMNAFQEYHHKGPP